MFSQMNASITRFQFSEFLFTEVNFRRIMVKWEEKTVKFDSVICNAKVLFHFKTQKHWKRVFTSKWNSQNCILSALAKVQLTQREKSISIKRLLIIECDRLYTNKCAIRIVCIWVSISTFDCFLWYFSETTMFNWPQKWKDNTKITQSNTETLANYIINVQTPIDMNEIMEKIYNRKKWCQEFKVFLMKTSEYFLIISDIA